MPIGWSLFLYNTFEFQLENIKKQILLFSILLSFINNTYSQLYSKGIGVSIDTDWLGYLIGVNYEGVEE